MNVKEIVVELVDYIENHISEPLDMERISCRMGYSKSYLHKLFLIYTGVSIMTYTRRRKLFYALEMLQTDKRLLDIALDLGFASERSFSRAFCSKYGKAPGSFRSVSYEDESKMPVYDLQLPDEEWIDMLKEYLSDVKYVTLEPMHVISGIRQGMEPEEEIINAMQQFAIDNKIEVKRSFGFDSPVGEDLSQQGGRGYEFWLKVDEDALDKVQGSEFVTKFIPSYKYVTLRIEDPFENPMVKIPNGWKTLVAWLETNVENVLGKELCLDCLEEVIEINGKMYMDIFIPIDKA